LKDFIGPAISVVALIVSITALYLTYRTVEDFSFSIGSDWSIPNPDYDKSEFIIYGPRMLTFINAGTRPVAVMSIGLALKETRDFKDEPKECSGDKLKTASFDVQPFVVNPKEIIIKPSLVDPKIKRNDRGDPVVAMDPEMRWVLSCVSFELITADKMATTVRAPLLAAEFESRPYGTVTLFTPDKPIKLLPR
jgi:hypothetical protein